MGPQIHNLWREHRQALEAGNLKTALRTARLGVRAYVHADDLKHAGIWQRAVSNVLHLQGQYSGAVREARAALKIQPDIYERGLSLIQLGQMLTCAGRYRAAFTTYDQALEVANRFPKDTYMWTHFFGNRALAYMRTGQIDKSIIEWEGAASLFRSNGQYWRAALYVNNIGFLLLKGGHFREAERRLMEALELIEQDSHLHSEAVVYDSFGCLYTLMGRYGDARVFLRRAIRTFETLPDKAQLASTVLHLSEMHKSMGQFEDAHTTGVRALDLALEVESKPLIAEVREHLKRLALTQAQKPVKEPETVACILSKVVRLQDYSRHTRKLTRV
jgi:tetratricopeptide (TPR) repeat protein